MPQSPGKPQKPELKFAPLSEGLGFHPFSDGLPYAPIGKTQTSKVPATGTGATAAGSPSFATPTATPAQAPRIQAPRMPVHPSAGKPPIPTYATPAPSLNPSPARRTSVPQPISAPRPLGSGVRKAQSSTLTARELAATLTPELLQPTFGLGYVIRRAAAYLTDTAFNLGLCVGALSAALWKQDLSPELLFNPGIVLVAGLFLGFFNWAITTAQEVAFGTSIGKRLFGLALEGTASAIFLRAFFFLPSLCFGGIGILWALFDRRRRCWHDLVVDLQPIEISRA